MSEEEDEQQKDVGKGKTTRKNDTWTMEESNELLNLLVDGCKRGWRNTSGVISKQTVETRILPVLNEKLKHMNANAVFKPKTFENYLSRWKWFKKRYTDMCTLMRLNSGFGWSHKDQIFTAPEEVWKDFIEVCFTSVADYDDLRIVVGNGTAVGRASFGVGTETDAPVYGLEDKRKSALEDLSWNDETGTFSQSDYEYSLDQFDNTVDSENQFDNTPRTKRFRNQVGTISSSNISSKDQLLEKLCSDVHSMSNNFDAIRIAMEKRGALWDAMKEVPNMENQTRFKAMKLIVGRELKEMFIAMSPDERYEWSMFQMGDDI
ncbi:hypothetical protein MKW94_021910 [Papaver nudicaule]|uniref:Myb/SANT-like domain-containing protein n=1 Tax=Papaver nudicaule TaxID=74823 RepID=A0AA41SKE4_PAPNU|nr:hypothetical protein [Papaver nudicaule]